MMNDIVRRGFGIEISPSYSDFSSTKRDRCIMTQEEIENHKKEFFKLGGKIQYIKGVDSTPAVREKTFAESNHGLDKKLGIKGLAKKDGISTKNARRKKIDGKLAEGYMLTREFRSAARQPISIILSDIRRNKIKGVVEFCNCKIIPESELQPYIEYRASLQK